jgi:hypothetical protein
MVRYWGAWTPYVVVGAIFILSAPWLALIALVLVALVALAALAALASAIVFVPYRLSRSVVGHWHCRSDASFAAGSRPVALHRGCAQGPAARRSAPRPPPWGRRASPSGSGTQRQRGTSLRTRSSF